MNHSKHQAIYWLSCYLFGFLSSLTLIKLHQNLDKATHTDKYLQFNSHHPSQHKRSVTRTLLDRAKNIPSTDADKSTEIQHVVNALKINGYTNQFIGSCKNTTVSTNQSQTNRGFVTLPYLQGIPKKKSQEL